MKMWHWLQAEDYFGWRNVTGILKLRLQLEEHLYQKEHYIFITQTKPSTL